MLSVENLSKTYGQGDSRVVALDGVEFGAKAGEFLCIVGPSGCGKTTLLKCMAGLLPPSGGQVLLHGQPVLGPPPQMALVFQDYSRSLLPWRSVQANVALPLRAKHMPREQLQTLVDEPFASVDAQTRADLEDLLLSVWRRLGITALFVTHDIDESVYLADRVVILSSPPAPNLKKNPDLPP